MPAAFDFSFVECRTVDDEGDVSTTIRSVNLNRE